MLERGAAAVGIARDLGLRRGIGTLGLAGSVVNNVVGSGIYALPAAVALLAGGAAPWAFLLSALIVAGVVVCFAEAGSRVPTSGGAYGTVEAAFGPAAAAVTGVMFLASNILADSGVAAAVADGIGGALPWLATMPARAVLIAAVYVPLVALNLLAVGAAARAIAAVAAIKLLPLAAFILAACFAPAAAGTVAGYAPAVTALGFSRAIVLTVFAFSGYECALLNSGEIRDPSRTLPRALLLSMLLILGLYLGVQLGAQHLLGPALPRATAPLAEAAARFGPGYGRLMLGAASLSMLGFMASDLLGSSRLVFAFGRDGLLPGWFGHVHRGTGVPARALLAYAALAYGLAVSGSFLELVFLSGMTVVIVYALGCIAAVVLRRQRVALAGQPLNVRGLWVAAALGLAGVVALALSARPAEFGGMAILVAAGLLLHGFRRLRPRVVTP